MKAAPWFRYTQLLVLTCAPAVTVASVRAQNAASTPPESPRPAPTEAPTPRPADAPQAEPPTDGQKPVASEPPTPATPKQHRPITRLIDLPDWAFDAQWYYVLVPRFANGSTDNDPPGTRAWGEGWPKAGQIVDEARQQYLDELRYGGDLQGLRKRLPYLKDLGFNALILSHVFAGAGEFKWHTIDWRHVDDDLAVKGSLAKLAGETHEPETWSWSESDKLFFLFIKEAHAAGFKVVLDVDFNSVSADFWAFQDVRRNGSASPYAVWFDLAEAGPPVKWNGPDGENGARVFLRRARTGLSPLAENHLFYICRRYLDPNEDGDPSDGIDGWRVDSVAQIDHGFWQRWHLQVKKYNPNAIIIGELWQDPGDWLLGDELDTVFNFKAAGIMRRFFSADTRMDLPPSRMSNELEANRKTLQPGTNAALLTLLNSPDTDRILSRLAQAPRPAQPPPDAEIDGAEKTDTASRDTDPPPASAPPAGDRASRPPSQNAEGTPEAKSEPADVIDPADRWRMITAFRAFYPGAAVTYYGEEVGMTGDSPPLARAPTWWPADGPSGARPEGYREDFLQLTRLLNTLRRAHEPIRRGDCRPLMADDEKRVVAFSRSVPGKSVIAVYNCSTRNQTVRLKAGGPGELVGVLAPQLRPARATGPDLHVNGSRAIADPDGFVELNLDPMSVRLLLVPEGPVGDGGW
ncbi:MAG: hypothetical protein C4547_01930 [Phycisphaerales bacterium]|nr:MAG: hypothetical protein C4547_01930 [Phycisphaerales bacterium]